MATKDLVFRFIGVDGGAGREFDRMAGKSATLEKAIGALGVGMVAAAGTIAVESVRAAAKFQQSMELIHTQAGRSQAAVNQMSKEVLKLAGPTATSPDELAKGLYHLASTGLSTAKSMHALQIAAQGAKMGGADLESVTNALNATIVSGIKGSRDYAAAMGALNATVGAGDMRMQDLADALSTGVLASVKGFGLSLNDVGAALATFGDNNMRGAEAATQLRMAVLFMAKPAASAKKELEALGMTQSTLANDMRTKGLGGALIDLHDHLVKAGDTGAKMGQTLVELFGHRAGTGLAVLEGQMGRFQQKQEEVAHGSKNFASDWQSYTQTFGYSWDRAKSAFESMTIQLGTKLLPTATKAMNWIGTTGVQDLDRFGGWVSRNKGSIEDLAKVLGAIAAFRFTTGALSKLGHLTGVTSGAGGVLGPASSMGRPVPVFVTNEGFGGKGGGGIPGGGLGGGATSRLGRVVNGLGNAMNLAAAGATAYEGTSFLLHSTPVGKPVAAAADSVANFFGVGPKQAGQAEFNKIAGPQLKDLVKQYGGLDKALAALKAHNQSVMLGMSTDAGRAANKMGDAFGGAARTMAMQQQRADNVVLVDLKKIHALASQWTVAGVNMGAPYSRPQGGLAGIYIQNMTVPANDPHKFAREVQDQARHRALSGTPTHAGL